MGNLGKQEIHLFNNFNNKSDNHKKYLICIEHVLYASYYAKHFLGLIQPFAIFPTVVIASNNNTNCKQSLLIVTSESSCQMLF